MELPKPAGYPSISWQFTRVKNDKPWETMINHDKLYIGN
jgi:hypothetical protein